MKALLDDLDSAGRLTPISIFREFQRLSHELDILCSAAISRSALSCADGDQLAALRDQFALHVSNPKAEYYDAFKQKYDLCRLVLSLRDSERCTEYLQLIQNRGRGDARRDPSPLVEIRYTHA